jgi:hypothetical protein
MNINTNISVWGCLVASNVWSASPKEDATSMAIIWLALAVVIMFVEWIKND